MPNELKDARRPPAFQEYGADLLAMESLRMMTLAERGLLATMRWAIWGNDTLPADPAALARVLGLDEAEVRANLPAVLGFFEPVNGTARLACPELRAQMTRLLDRRDRMVDGAHKSHIARKQKRNPPIATHDGTHHGSEKSRTEQSRAEKSASREEHQDPWVKDYETTAAAQRRIG